MAGTREKAESETFARLRSSLAYNVRALRHAKQWTQEQAAERCGISTYFFQQIEWGTANVTLGTLASLLDGFGVSVAVLFNDVRGTPSKDA